LKTWSEACCCQWKLGDAWKEEAQGKVEELGATVAFDAIAGQSTGDLLDYCEENLLSTSMVVSQERSKMDPGVDLSRKEAQGFFLSAWLEQGGTLNMLYRMMAASPAKVSQQRT
jgi:hypothetical protein